MVVCNCLLIFEWSSCAFRQAVVTFKSIVIAFILFSIQESLNLCRDFFLNFKSLMLVLRSLWILILDS